MNRQINDNEYRKDTVVSFENKTGCKGDFDMAVILKGRSFLRRMAFTPEEINERIAKLTREDIISCAKTFKPDTVFVIRGEEEEDCDE